MEKMNDELTQKDPYGIKNVCFSRIEQDDKRWDVYKKQRCERGFDNSELWSLDTTIAQFVLPRLKKFREIRCGQPTFMTDDEWDNAIASMIDAFDLIIKDNTDAVFKLSYEDNKKIRNGLSAFCGYFCHLWF